MTTDEAEAIIELAARYWRNQWDPNGDSKSSREVILEAARVLLDAAADAKFNEDVKDLYRNRIWLLLKRTQRAETAAREMANLLRNLAVRGEFRDGSGAIASVAKALTRHSEYAPDTSDRNEDG